MEWIRGILFLIGVFTFTAGLYSVSPALAAIVMGFGLATASIYGSLKGSA